MLLIDASFLSNRFRCNQQFLSEDILYSSFRCILWYSPRHLCCVMDFQGILCAKPEFLSFNWFPFLFAIYTIFRISCLLYAIGYKSVLPPITLSLQNNSRQSAEFPRAVTYRYLGRKPCSPFSSMIIGSRHKALIICHCHLWNRLQPIRYAASVPPT